MNTTRRTYYEIGCPEPRGTGQRFFRVNGSDAIYVADNSGSTPDRTDDGPLRVLTDRPLRVGVSRVSGKVDAIVEVYSERDGRECVVGLTAREAAWCAELPMETLLSPRATQVLEDLHRLFVASTNWTDAKNERRCRLIDKEIEGTLSGDETAELKRLQDEMLVYRNTVAPLPVAELRELRRKMKGGES